MKRLSVSRTANSNLQNRMNVSIIFNYLRVNGASYRAKISKDLNISAPAVSRAVENLIKHGYVVEKDKIKTSYGGKAAEIRVNLEKGRVLGIDLIKENMKIGIFNLNGDMLDSHSGIKLYGSSKIDRDIEDEIDKFIHEYSRIGKAKREHLIRAVGVGVPATVGADSGSSLKLNLYGNMQGVDLRDLLKRKYQVPVYVENEAKLSALSEKKYGQGKNYRNLVFVEISNGIGAGIIIDDSLIKGVEGFAGEIGSTIIGKENLGYQRNNTKGYLESFASVESIRERAEAEIGKGRPSIISELAEQEGGVINPAQVTTAALRGDPLAVEIISSCVDHISISVLNLILILNPAIVVVGGDICRLPGVEELFVRGIRKRIQKVLPFKMPEIQLSILGENAGVIGAANLAIESMLAEMYPYMIEQ